jgi:Tfp pilus assembly protein PilO
MKNNFQKIILLISIIILLLFCFIFVFLYKKINNNNQKTQQDTINLQTESHRRDDIASLNQMLQKIAPDRALLENHFIKSSDVVPFLNIIENLAKESGVSVQIDSVDAKIDNTELTVGLKVSGRFEAIYKFLTLLENSPYVLDFMSMDIHKLLSPVVSDKNVNNTNWEAVFQIQLLSFIP